MTLLKRVSAAAAVVGVLAVAAPLAEASAAAPLPVAPGTHAALATTAAVHPANPFANVCLKGVVDPGPFGPLGPYGPKGPYGPNGPLHGRPNPIGDAATCGGFVTFLLRGGTLSSFVQGNLAAVGH
jgi:hypothetical protein